MAVIVPSDSSSISLETAAAYSNTLRLILTTDHPYNRTNTVATAPLPSALYAIFPSGKAAYVTVPSDNPSISSNTADDNPNAQSPILTIDQLYIRKHIIATASYPFISALLVRTTAGTVYITATNSPHSVQRTFPSVGLFNIHDTRIFARHYTNVTAGYKTGPELSGSNTNRVQTLRKSHSHPSCTDYA